MELTKSMARMKELDTIFRKFYSDNALGKLSDHQFVTMTSDYEDEKKSLAERTAVLEREINTVVERSADVNRFLQIVEKYTNIQELTYENIHEFILV